MATLTMRPDPDLLVEPTGDRISPNGRPTPQFREHLRTIPSWANAWTVVFVWLQTIAVLVAAVWIDHPITWVLAFLLIGRAHVQLNILQHEAAHRLLFANRRLNDWVGRWLLAYPALVPIDLYRRGHMAHHREEFGPNEPDIPMYRNYPITRDSMRRKLTRDALGITGFKLLRGLFGALRSTNADARHQARCIFATQAVLLVIAILVGHPWLYPLLWLLPHLTVWRVLNRLRAIAEHGGMVQSPDRRETTHAVRQSLWARFWFVPFNTGWHLAHHADSGIPWRRLPEYHRELVRSGYVQDGLEYPNYRALWRALASRAPD
ncbi:MAG: fatty acid desaturase [Acidimicrobiia bacterium]